MMVMMMSLLHIGRIGRSEELESLSVTETCSGDVKQVQVLMRELEEAKTRIAQLEKQSTIVDLQWIKKSANEGIVSMSKFVSNPRQGSPLIQDILEKMTLMVSFLRDGIVQLLSSSDVMSQVEVEFIVDTSMYFIVLLVGILISQKIFVLSSCCSSSSEKRQKKKKRRR